MASNMKYNYLGTSGIRVSEVCMGCMTFGNGTTEEEAHQMLDVFVSAGGNFIDTADVYSGGQSEIILGKWLAQQQRKNLVVATKVYFGGPGPNDRGLSRAHIMHNVEQSLQRLQTSYIDIYQIHNWDHHTDVEVWLGTFRDLVHAGKIRMLGVCNVTGWQLQKIIITSRAMGVPLMSLQTQYSLLCREPEFELLDCAIHENIGWLCWSPLKGGWLTGKFKRDSKPGDDSRIGQVESGKVPKMQSAPSYTQFANDNKIWDLLDAMTKVAAAHNTSVASVALRWALQRQGITSVIIGARTMAQLKDNLTCSDFRITADEMGILNKISAPAVPYPYEMVWRCSTTASSCRMDGNLFPTSQL